MVAGCRPVSNPDGLWVEVHCTYSWSSEVIVDASRE